MRMIWLRELKSRICLMICSTNKVRGFCANIMHNFDDEEGYRNAVLVIASIAVIIAAVVIDSHIGG